MINFYLLAADATALDVSGLQPASAASATTAPVSDPAAPLVEVVAPPMLSASLSHEQTTIVQDLVQAVLRTEGTQETVDAFKRLTDYINTGAGETHDALTRAIQGMNNFNLLVGKLTQLEKSGKVSLEDIETFAKSMLRPEQAAALKQVVTTFNTVQATLTLLQVLYAQVEQLPLVGKLAEKAKVSCTSCCGSSKTK